MSLASLLTQPVTLHEPTGTSTDGFGHTTAAWEPHEVTGYVRNVSTGTTNGGPLGELARTTRTLYLRPDVTIAAGWQVEIGGARFAVAGKPTVQWNPRTQTVEYVAVELLEVAP